MAAAKPTAPPRARPLLQEAPPRLTAMTPVPPMWSGSRASLLRETKGLKMSVRRMEPSLAEVPVRHGRALRRGAVLRQAGDGTTEVPVVTRSTWQSLVIESERMVLVSFWAPWCGPCRIIHPVIAEIAAEYSGKLDCYELNTDENPEIAARYGIRGIPTISFFKQGERKDHIIGTVPKSRLISSVERLL